MKKTSKYPFGLPSCLINSKDLILLEVEESMKKPTWLLDFKYDRFSQHGEDGIIEKILEIIPEKDNHCVEFGAWDGIAMSNTRNLIINKNYSAVLIEGDSAKFEELKRNYSENPNVITINKFVGFGEDDNLDQILKDTPVPFDFDFLSIDIDGNDYHVWKAMKKFRPKVVCIEFNPTIPTEVEFVQPPDHSLNQGASLLSLVKLGKEKGYELVAVSLVNAFFVRKEFFPLFEIEDNRPEILRTNLDYVTYIFLGYDGTLFLRGFRRSPWHEGIELDESNMQIIPHFIRKYPQNYNEFENKLFSEYLQLLSSYHNDYCKAIIKLSRKYKLKNLLSLIKKGFHLLFSDPLTFFRKLFARLKGIICIR